jgi:hypothetical protein
MKHMLRLVIATIALNWCVAQVPGYVPTQDLVAWYNFSGNFQDASPANNHLTAVNTANLTMDRFGNPSSAFLASTSGHLTNTAPSFTINPTQPFTMSIWWNKTGGTVAMMIGTTVNGNFITNIQSGGTASQFGTNRQGAAWIWAQSTVTLNTWEHYVAVYDAPNMIFYKNGVQVATNTYTHTGANSVNHPLWVGRGVGGGNFVGALDDIGIWMRALTPAEVQQLYSGCPAGFTAQPASGTHPRGANVQLVAPRITATTTSQWQVDTGSGFANITASPRFSGVTGDTLTINAIDFDLNQAAFRCINSATTCSETSQVAVLTVQCTNLIQAQPIAQTGRINQSVTFLTGATDPAASFQWQVNDGSGFANLTATADITGVNTDALTLSNLQMTQNGNIFRCLITLGPCSDTTNPAPLTVINDIGLENHEQATVRVYPNPAVSSWTIEVAAHQRNLAYILYDGQGKRVQSGTLMAGVQQLDGSQLPAGTYLLEVTGRQPMRLVKQ